MSIIDWQEDYSLGVPAMDCLHKQLTTMVNHLYETMQQSEGEEVIKRILSSLIQSIKYHLSAEEKVIQEPRFHRFAVHFAIHKELTRQVLRVMNEIKNGKAVLTVKIALYLKDWLINHIEGQNKQYKQHIAHIDQSGQN